MALLVSETGVKVRSQPLEEVAVDRRGLEAGRGEVGQSSLDRYSLGRDPLTLWPKLRDGQGALDREFDHPVLLSVEVRQDTTYRCHLDRAPRLLRSLFGPAVQLLEKVAWVA